MISMTLYAIGEERPRIHPDAYVHPKAVLIARFISDRNPVSGRGSSFVLTMDRSLSVLGRPYRMVLSSTPNP